jgi:hypothetical protein
MLDSYAIMVRRFLFAIVGCSFLFACTSATEEPVSEGSDSALFGVGVAKYALTVVQEKSGTPLCFEVNAFQNNSLFDIAGAEMYRDTTTTPFFYLPAKATTSGKEYVGLSVLCAGADGKLYVAAQEYVPPANIVPGLHSGGVIGTAVRTTGPRRYFRVGELRPSPKTLSAGEHVEMKDAPIDGDFKIEFRQMETQGYEDTVDMPPAWTFVITSDKAVTELSSPPVIATIP